MTGYCSFMGPLSGFYIGESVSFTTKYKDNFLQSWQPCTCQWRSFCLARWLCHLIQFVFNFVSWERGSWCFHVCKCYCNQLVYFWIYCIWKTVWLSSQALNMDDLNIAQISGCNWVQKSVHHNYGQSADPSSCSSGNATHAFLYNLPHTDK